MWCAVLWVRSVVWYGVVLLLCCVTSAYLCDEQALSSVQVAATIVSSRSSLKRELQKNQLNQFLRHRPSYDDLAEKGILKKTEETTCESPELKRRVQAAIKASKV